MVTLTELLKDTTTPTAAATPFYTAVILPAVRAGQLNAVTRYLEEQAALIMDIDEVELPFVVTPPDIPATMLVPGGAGVALDALREVMATYIDEISTPLYAGRDSALSVLRRLTLNRYLGASKVGAAVLAYALHRYTALQEDK